MRLLATLVLAIIASGLAGAVVAVGLADWADGDESYILVFLAIPVAVVIAAIGFLIAGTRAVPGRAVNRACLVLCAVVGVLLAWMVAMTLLYEAGTDWASRSIKLAVAINASMLAVVLVQWIAFRSGLRRGAPPSAAHTQFGRQSQ